MILLYYWSREFSVSLAQLDAEVAPHTAVDAYQWLRDVCSSQLLQAPIKLGGEGVIVQVDESLFRHKPKVSTKLMK